jgi:hypothetical protein
MRAKQYKFTLRDVADSTGLPISKVYRDVRLGRLDPGAINSLAAYIVRENNRAAEPKPAPEKIDPPTAP